MADGALYLHLSLVLPIDATVEEGEEAVATAIPERQAPVATTVDLHSILKLLHIVRSRERHWKTSSAAEGHR
eukprot:7115366-Pyramimonas_sp.AAC.1